MATSLGSFSLFKIEKQAAIQDESAAGFPARCS
jgi:hypothetical protein